MHRKDYILIANALRNYRNEPDANHNSWSGIEEVSNRICDALATDNPRFNREHFLAVVRGEKDLNSRPARRQS
jgi:hypothetical protein